MTFLRDIKVEDGWLWKNINCGWEQVARWCCPDDPSVPDPDPDPPTEYRCGKSHGLAAKIISVAMEIIDLHQIPYTIDQRVYIQQASPGLHWVTSGLWNIFSWLVGEDDSAIETAISGGAFFTDLKCLVYNEATSFDNLSPQELTAIKSKIALNVAEPQATMLNLTIDSVTGSSWSEVAWLSARDTTADCTDCESGEGGFTPEPDANGWYLGAIQPLWTMQGSASNEFHLQKYTIAKPIYGAVFNIGGSGIEGKAMSADNVEVGLPSLYLNSVPTYTAAANGMSAAYDVRRSLFDDLGVPVVAVTGGVDFDNDHNELGEWRVAANTEFGICWQTLATGGAYTFTISGLRFFHNIND